MPAATASGHRALFLEAQRTLGVNLDRMGELTGTSQRTAQRISAGRALMYPSYFPGLAAAVFPEDAELAARLAAAAGGTLESLGIVKPAPPPPPPAPPPAPAPPSPPPMPRHLAVDAVVCVAADSMQATPAQIRGPLLAAFRRARELGLTYEEVEKVLDGATATK